MLLGNELFVFDVVPPRQYVGHDAYHKDWQDFLAMFNGPLKVELSDLSVTTSGDVGYGHSIANTLRGTQDGGTSAEQEAAGEV